MISWRKIWHFIWKEDSLASFLVNILIAIILVKFVIFPVLGWFFGTSYPVVAVVSCSMEHGYSNCGSGASQLCGDTDVKDIDNFDDYWNTCGSWYEERGINKEKFLSYPLKNGFNKGDIMVLFGSKDYKVGDVIVFSTSFGDTPIIHRVVSVEEDVLQTKGDHNVDQMLFERNIKKEKVIGKAVLKIPYIGWIKVIFNEIIGGMLR